MLPCNETQPQFGNGVGTGRVGIAVVDLLPASVLPRLKGVELGGFELEKPEPCALATSYAYTDLGHRL